MPNKLRSKAENGGFLTKRQEDSLSGDKQRQIADIVLGQKTKTPTSGVGRAGIY